MTAADEDGPLVLSHVEAHDCDTAQQLFALLAPRVDARAETLVVALLPQLDADGEEVVGVNARAAWTNSVSATSLRLMAEIINDIAGRIETMEGERPHDAPTH